jgi:hypothetical protein
MISILFDNSGTMLCHCLPWINRSGYVVSNWLDTLVSLLPLLTNNNLWLNFFKLQMIDFILISLSQATYPQSHIGYCPLLDFDGDTLTQSTVV